MIRSEQVAPRGYFEEPAWIVHYETPKRKGSERFGGLKARQQATIFAVSILDELLDSQTQEDTL